MFLCKNLMASELNLKCGLDHAYTQNVILLNCSENRIQNNCVINDKIMIKISMQVVYKENTK